MIGVTVCYDPYFVASIGHLRKSNTRSRTNYTAKVVANRNCHDGIRLSSLRPRAVDHKDCREEARAQGQHKPTHQTPKYLCLREKPCRPELLDELGVVCVPGELTSELTIAQKVSCIESC
jgi:hypothetical protein